jgi:DNA polymerase III gamma/tau subunit
MAVSEYLERELLYGKGFKEEENGMPVLLKLELLKREWNIILEEEEELELSKETSKKENVPPEPKTVASPFFNWIQKPSNQEVKVQPEPKTVPSPFFNWGQKPSNQDAETEEADTVFASAVPVDNEPVDVVSDQQQQPTTMRTMDIVDTVMEPEVMDVVVEQAKSSTRPTFSSDAELLQDVIVEDEPDMLRRVAAEIVTDDDFDVAVGEARTVETMSETELDAEEEQNNKPNPVVRGVLRTLDVLFLVVEKSLTVRSIRWNYFCYVACFIEWPILTNLYGLYPSYVSCNRRFQVSYL